MRLPVPGPRDLVAVLERGAESIDSLLGAAPRLLGLLDRAEELVTRAADLVGGIEQVRDGAAAVVLRTDGVVSEAQAQVRRIAPLLDRLTPLLDALEPSLTRLQPTLERLAETTDPDEVEALVKLVDQLPELAHRMETEVMPVLTTLGTVAPDMHDLLEVSRELNDMLAKLPGLGRIKKRIDREQGEDEPPS